MQGGVIINTSESDTRVLVENGETAIIGGLIRKVESKLNSGMPVLMDIPLLGALFRHSTDVKASRELVVFVTPRIVTDPYLKRAQADPRGRGDLRHGRPDGSSNSHGRRGSSTRRDSQRIGGPGSGAADSRLAPDPPRIRMQACGPHSSASWAAARAP